MKKLYPALSRSGAKAFTEMREELEGEIIEAEEDGKRARWANRPDAEFYNGYASACKHFRVMLDKVEKAL